VKVVECAEIRTLAAIVSYCRGAPLSQGWTATDKETGKKCVVCPYHGWAFDNEGKLRDVPSADKGSWPNRPLINSYPVSSGLQRVGSG
jgi:phenylpropionate dioxygenase-like ring-hydroxylating dioxygenase large terminal subunit